MKRIIVIISAIIIILLALCAVAGSILGVFVRRPDINEISSGQLLEIKHAYLEIKNVHYPEHMTTDNISVIEYCGTYNGCVVMMFTDSQAMYMQAIRVVNVAGIKIQYSDGNELFAYKDGEMYTLEQAYSNGFLTKSDIFIIRCIHYKH